MSKLKVIPEVSTHSNKTSKYILTVNIFPLQEMSIIKLLQNNNVLSLMHPSSCKARNSNMCKTPSNNHRHDEDDMDTLNQKI